MLLALLGLPSTSQSVPLLSSYPAARAVVYLDFDGHNVNSAVWNSGVAFTAAPGTFTDLQIREIFNRVAEDYRPFDLNITTDLAVFLNAPLTQRIRVVVTSTSSWYPGVGGVAYIGSFTWGDDTPAFVFADRLGPNSPKMVAECISHETGHTLGLNHQSTYDENCNLTAVYNLGAGVGETGWAPIMGNSYYRNMTGWYNGRLPYGCSYTEDNLQIITTYNGFGYRPDDYPNELNSSAFTLSGLNMKQTGLISNNTDVDVFRFVLAQRYRLLLSAKPSSFDGLGNGANLDVKLRLHAANGSLISVSDPIETLNASLDTMLQAGTYYLVVEGASNANTSSYGSVGEYEFNGTLAGVLPIQSVALTLQAQQNKPRLSWMIETTDPIAGIWLQTSANGQQFSTSGTLPTQIQYRLFEPIIPSGHAYFRLLVRDVRGEEKYSNVVYHQAGQRIKVIQPQDKTQPIQLQMPEPAPYELLQTAGARVRSGQLNAGTQVFRLDPLPAGTYYLRILLDGKWQTFPLLQR